MFIAEYPTRSTLFDAPLFSSVLVQRALAALGETCFVVQVQLGLLVISRDSCKRTTVKGFQVFVRNYAYKEAPRTLTIHGCLPDDTIEMLRLKLHIRLRAYRCVTREFAKFYAVQFMHAGKYTLWDRDTLESYGITNDSTVFVLPRVVLPSGAKTAHWRCRLRLR